MKNHRISATKSTITILVICTTLFASCTRYYYRPNSVQAPLLSNKGDIHLVANATPFETETIDETQAKNHVIGLQVAASPFKYVGIIGGYTNYRYKITANPVPQNGLVDAKANVWDIGAGGYYTLKENKKKITLLFDCYASYGAGSMKSDVNMDFNKLFIQPGFGIRAPYFEASFNLRFMGIKYSNLDANDMPDYYLNSNYLITDNGGSIVDKRHLFVEPAFTARGGYKFIKGQVQVVLSQSTEPVSWVYNESLVTFGLYLGLEDLIKQLSK